MKLLVLLLLTPSFSFATIWYVTTTGSGTQNGTSWSNARSASDLQTTINGAQAGDQVWVACGTYYPSTSNRASSFSMRNGIQIYGGFQGNETLLNQRNLSCGSCSILSGEIGSSQTNDNIFHVIYNSNLDSTAIMDGFVVTGANDDRTPSSFGDGLGGGMYNHGFGNGGFCSPTLKNIIFQFNEASWGAGAFNNGYNQGFSQPTYINCVFYRNHSYIEAGGMDSYGVNGNASPSLYNCLFYENSANTNVGAMYAWGGTNGNANPRLYNCAFVRNYALAGYAGAFIADNSDESGGGSSGTSNVTLTNCIVWGNSATGTGQQFYKKGSGSTVNAFNTCIDLSGQNAPHDLTSSNSILTSNPNFLNLTSAQGADSCWFTTDDGLRLSANSLCIDYGNDLNTLSTDLAGAQRIQGVHVDLGPYEFQPTNAVESLSNPFISLYPNPSSGTFFLELENKDKVEIQVFDMLGRKIPVSIVREENLQICLHAFPGTYRLVVIGKDNHQSFSILVK